MEWCKENLNRAAPNTTAPIREPMSRTWKSAGRLSSSKGISFVKMNSIWEWALMKADSILLGYLRNWKAMRNEEERLRVLRATIQTVIPGERKAIIYLGRKKMWLTDSFCHEKWDLQRHHYCRGNNPRSPEMIIQWTHENIGLSQERQLYWIDGNDLRVNV